MQNLGSETMTWYTYVAVENNDYRLVDHQGYSSFIYIKPERVSKDSVNIHS